MSFEFQTLCCRCFMFLHDDGSVARFWLVKTNKNIFFAKRMRTVTSSVILRTSLPFEDLHFMLYRVSRGRQTEIHSFERSRSWGWAYLSG